jgi:hypothetical protein
MFTLAIIHSALLDQFKQTGLWLREKKLLFPIQRVILQIRKVVVLAKVVRDRRLPE